MNNYKLFSDVANQTNKVGWIKHVELCLRCALFQNGGQMLSHIKRGERLYCWGRFDSQEMRHTWDMLFTIQ